MSGIALKRSPSMCRYEHPAGKKQHNQHQNTMYVSLASDWSSVLVLVLVFAVLFFFAGQLC